MDGCSLGLQRHVTKSQASQHSAKLAAQSLRLDCPHVCGQEWPHGMHERPAGDRIGEGRCTYVRDTLVSSPLLAGSLNHGQLISGSPEQLWSGTRPFFSGTQGLQKAARRSLAKPPSQEGTLQPACSCHSTLGALLEPYGSNPP